MSEEPPPHTEVPLDLSQILTRQDFGRALTCLREQAGLTVRQVARAVGLPTATAGDYFGGAHLPPARSSNLLAGILAACGVTEPAAVKEWLRVLERIRRAPGKRPAGAPTPYRGLESYQPEHADWFFGRERLVQLLVERLADQHADRTGPLWVVGPSGSGKSSLLRAGLISAVRHGRLPVSGTDTWQVVLFTPGAHPLRALEDQLTSISGTHGGESVAQRRLIVVDQFEELFTTCTDRHERQQFIEALLSRQRSDAATDLVVVGLRADFYPHALRDPRLAHAYNAPSWSSSR